MKPLIEAELSGVRLIATDMDGTLTHRGKFTAELLMALESLAASQITVLIVTGRSGGWVSAIANYLPVVGAIAENGGLFYNSANHTSELITDLGDLASYRLQLKKVFHLLKNKFPQIAESSDNPFRITDWTFDLGDLTPSELTAMESLCESVGFGFTYSTVQCHIKPQKQNKAIALQQVLKRYFPDLDSKQVVTIGDSPNDESLFDGNLFPLSVGVSNIADYCDRLKHQPAYVTSLPEVAGFSQLAKCFAK